MGLAKVLVWDACPVGLPRSFTVAHLGLISVTPSFSFFGFKLFLWSSTKILPAFSKGVCIAWEKVRQ